jgi:hypothetical protein
VTENNIADFVRQYDGARNPVGIGKTDAKWAEMLAQVGYRVLDLEVHYFRCRFLTFGRFVPAFVHRLLGRCAGTVVCFNLATPPT